MKIYESVPGQFPGNAALDLVPLPGESIVSSLWRFAWRNGLGVKELLRFCSGDARYAKDNGRYSPTRGFDPDIFMNASGWIDHSCERQVVDDGYEAHRSMWWSRYFRYCPVCLEHLYHSHWHQSQFLSHCPFDGAELLTHCYCCGTLLPAYGVYRSLLGKPYACPKCRGPISGIDVTLHARLAVQQRAGELRRIVSSIEHWWAASAPARHEIEFLLGPQRADTHAPWLRAETSMRQWVLTMTSAPGSLPVATRTLPRLVVLKWKVKLDPDEPMAFLTSRRKSKHEKLDFARQVYRATLVRLLKAIARCEPFDDAQYRRHQILPVEDHLRYPGRCNMKLLALIMLRRNYETYFSSFESSPKTAELQQDNIGFPYGNEFAMRLRICWRAKFVVAYAAFYWGLVAMRNGHKAAKDLQGEALILSNVDIRQDYKQGDLIAGSVAFPEIDGLDLSLFP